MNPSIFLALTEEDIFFGNSAWFFESRNRFFGGLDDPVFVRAVVGVTVIVEEDFFSCLLLVIYLLIDATWGGELWSQKVNGIRKRQ